MTRPFAGSLTPTGYLQMGLLGQICLHRRLHTNLYYEVVDIIIVSAYNSASGDPVQQTENVKAALGTIKAFIVGLEKITPQF